MEHVGTEYIESLTPLEAAAERCSDRGAPPLPFEAWLALSSRLTHEPLDRRAEILAEAKVAPAIWERAEPYWGLTLAAEVARGDMTRAEAYGQACLSSRDRAAPPSMPPVFAAPRTPVATSEDVQPPPFQTSEESPPRELLPSYLRSDSKGTPSPPPLFSASPDWANPVEQSTTGEVPLLELQRPVTPFTPGEPTFATPRPALAPTRRSGQTVELPAFPSPPAPSSPSSPSALPAPPAPPITPQPQTTVVIDPAWLDAIIARGQRRGG